MTNGVRWSREHPVRLKSPIANRERGDGRGTWRCAPKRTSPFSPLPVLRNILPLQSQQVHEQSIRPRYTRRQLPEEAQARVHVSAAANGSHEQPALQLLWGIRRRIVRLEHRYVGRVPVVREVEATLLDPTAPLVRTDLVGIMKYRMGGIERGHRGVFVRHPIVRPSDVQWVGRKAAVHERVLLV